MRLLSLLSRLRPSQWKVTRLAGTSTVTASEIIRAARPCCGYCGSRNTEYFPAQGVTVCPRCGTSPAA